MGTRCKGKLIKGSEGRNSSKKKNSAWLNTPVYENPYRLPRSKRVKEN